MQAFCAAATVKVASFSWKLTPRYYVTNLRVWCYPNRVGWFLEAYSRSETDWLRLTNDPFRSDNALDPWRWTWSDLSLMCSYLALCFIGPIDYVRRVVYLWPLKKKLNWLIDWRRTPITWPNAFETVPWQPCLIWCSERSRYLRALNKMQCVQLIVSWSVQFALEFPEKERY